MLRFIVEALRSSSAPYVLTILFASVGWGITHAVDRVLKSPALEFRPKVSELDSSQKKFRVQIENISRDRSFSDLEFVFLLDPKQSGRFVSSPSVIPVSPAWEGDQAPEQKDHSVVFPIPMVHPGWLLTLEAQYTGPQQPAFRLRKSGQPVRLVTPSAETFFVKHEISFIGGTILLWLIVVVVIISTQPPVTQPPPKLMQVPDSSSQKSATPPNIMSLSMICVGGVTLLLASPTFFQQQTEASTVIEEIRVVEDGGRGIKSDLYVIKGTGQEEFFDETDDTGVVHPNYSCESGWRIRAKPKDQAYFHSSAQKCLVKLMLRVTSRRVLSNLQKNAEWARQNGEYGVAALVYNELSVRAAAFDSNLALKAETNAYEYAGRALGVEEPTGFDPTQKRVVLSPEFIEKIRAYQKTNGLPDSGKLDNATLTSLANAPIGRFLYSSPIRDN